MFNLLCFGGIDEHTAVANVISQQQHASHPDALALGGRHGELDVPQSTRGMSRQPSETVALGTNSTVIISGQKGDI
jgi:hypothetical protein